MKKESQRQKRVSEQVKQIIAEGLYTTSLSGTELAGQVTITNVNISKDLKHAHVFYTILGGYTTEDAIGEITEILNSHSREINTHIAKNMATKYTPKVQFFYDHTFEEASRVEQLLNEVSTERGSGTG